MTLSPNAHHVRAVSSAFRASERSEVDPEGSER
jgi:hypothetical protein